MRVVSVHNGFPFGLYHYIEATRGRELWVFGVPFMDSLSFTFLAFASYTVALLLSSPLYRRGADFDLDTWKIRRAPRVWLMAALFMVMVDMVVDPLSVLGDRWFLGKIFWYDPPGPHFGVPISNYLGWYFVAAITIAIFQWLDAALNRGATKPAGLMPCDAIARAARSRALCRHRAVRHHDAVPINAANIGWAAVFIYLPFSVLAIHILTRRESWRPCRDRASPGRFSVRARSSRLEANERAQAPNFDASPHRGSAFKFPPSVASVESSSCDDACRGDNHAAQGQSCVNHGRRFRNRPGERDTICE